MNDPTSSNTPSGPPRSVFAPSGGPDRPARPRSWPHAIGIAALAVYLPQLLPLLGTDLLDHGHCLGVYARYFPILVGLGPGVSARIASGLPDPQEEWLLIAVAIGVTLALLGGTTLSLRRWRRGGRVVTGVTALLATVLSFGAVAIIRM